MYDPAVESAEELSDVGTFVVIAPSPDHRVEIRDQFQSIQWHASPSSLPHLVHEASNLFFLRVRIEITATHPALDLLRPQPEWPLTPLDLIAKELKSMSNVDDPRLLRMK